MAFLMAQGVNMNSQCGVNIASPLGHDTELNSVMVNNNYLPGISMFRNVQNVTMQSQTICADTHSTQQTIQSAAAAQQNHGISDSVGDRVQCNLSPSLTCASSCNGNNENDTNCSWKAPYGACCHPSGAGNFTFTNPTQLSSPAVTLTTTNRYPYSRATSQSFAPTGSSVQWQHSVPQRMPWFHQHGMSSPQGISVLTGSTTAGICSPSWPSPSVSMPTPSLSMPTPSLSMPTPSLSMPTSCSHMYNPVAASCSESMHRCKRKHEIDNDIDLSPTSKIRLTDENIARHMQDLTIHRLYPMANMPVPIGAVSENMLRPVSFDCQFIPASQTSQLWPDLDFPLHLDRDTQWQNFQTLEERLETIDEDVESNEKEQSSSGGHPRLHIVQDIGRLVYQEPVVPKEILKKIMHPCWEVILWRPPGDGVKRLINKDDRKEDGADDDNVKGDEEVATMEAEIVGNIDSTSQTLEPLPSMESELEMDDMEDL